MKHCPRKVNMAQVQCVVWRGPMFITKFRSMFANTQELDDENE